MTMTLTETQQLDAIADQLDAMAAELEEWRRLRESIGDLAADLSPIAKQGLGSAAELLARSQENGTLDFARAGIGVADRVMTSFDEEDVEALGDNIVLILQTIREMTQPEVMQMMRSTIHHAGISEEPAEAPSLFELLRRLRDPEVRMGMYRLTVLLEGVGATHPEINEETPERKEAR